jgi:hypothetical protein
MLLRYGAKKKLVEEIFNDHVAPLGFCIGDDQLQEDTGSINPEGIETQKNE